MNTRQKILIVGSQQLVEEYAADIKGIAEEVGKADSAIGREYVAQDITKLGIALAEIAEIMEEVFDHA